MEIIKKTFAQGFKAVMSNGPEVKIDLDEVAAVVQSAAKGNFIKVRQGVINPSYIVAIVEDSERKIKFLEDTKYDHDRRAAGMIQLKDIFDNRYDYPNQILPPTAGG